MYMKFKGLALIFFINVIVFLITYKLSITDQSVVFHLFGYNKYSPTYTLFTYSFIHVNSTHLIENMAFFLVYGFYLEKNIGTPSFLLLYFLSATFSMYAFGELTDATLPCLGASGAVFGVMGASFANKSMPVLLSALSIYFFLVESVKSYLESTDSVAHLAHVLGFIFGILFILFYEKRNVVV